MYSIDPSIETTIDPFFCKDQMIKRILYINSFIFNLIKTKSLICECEKEGAILNISRMRYKKNQNLKL